MEFSSRKYLENINWKKDITGIALWISLNLADLITTIVTMDVMDGGFIEGNPIAALIGENIAGLVMYKLTLVFIAVVLLSRIHKLKLLLWLNLVMAAVVGWNLALLLAS